MKRARSTLQLLAAAVSTLGCREQVVVIAEGRGGSASTNAPTGTETSTETATGTTTATSSGTGTGTLKECCQDPDKFCSDCFAAEFGVHSEYFYESCMCGLESPCVKECAAFCEDMVPGHDECWACAVNNECSAKADDLCLSDPSCAPYFECISAVTPLAYCGS